MLIGVCGPVSSGKQSVANFLIRRHGCVQLHLKDARTYPLPGPRPEPDPSVVFDSMDGLINHATVGWQRNWVTTSVNNPENLDKLKERPLFILISVNGPVRLRYTRHKYRFDFAPQPPPTIGDFLELDDALLFDRRSRMAAVMNQADIRIVNTTPDLQLLYKHLQTRFIWHEGWVRPPWDDYFMGLASLAAQRSNCMKRRVGCVLVRDNRVISTGYNGTPRSMKNCNAGGCPRCNAANASGTLLSTCLCIHAEENALLEAGRDRIPQGTTLYCDTCPCLTCSIKIVQVGIQEVVFEQKYNLDESAARVLVAGKVKLRRYIPMKRGKLLWPPPWSSGLNTPLEDGDGGAMLLDTGNTGNTGDAGDAGDTGPSAEGGVIGPGQDMDTGS